MNIRPLRGSFVGYAKGVCTLAPLQTKTPDFAFAGQLASFFACFQQVLLFSKYHNTCSVASPKI